MADFSDNGIVTVKEPEHKDVAIRFKQSAMVDVELDIDRLTIGDLELLERLSGEETNNADLVALMQKVIPDQDVSQLPLRAMRHIVAAVIDAVGGETDPNG